jgi:hypothetical protein
MTETEKKLLEEIERLKGRIEELECKDAVSPMRWPVPWNPTPHPSWPWPDGREIKVTCTNSIR